MSRHQLTPLPSDPVPAARSPRSPDDGLLTAPPGFAAGLAGPAEAWLPDSGEEVLLVTSSAVVRAEVERIVAAAGAHLRVVADALEGARYWDGSAAVLVGSDIRELPPRRRAPAVLVGLDGEGDSLWHLAAALGAERVAVLPDAAAWLADHLSRSRAPGPGGIILGVTGGCGGAGATTAAIWIAQAAAGMGARVLLVDGDPWGGGLELAIAAEESPGLRWPDLSEARGSIDSGQLSDSLPVSGGFSFLSWPATREQPVSVAAPTITGVLDAARRAFELVVLDIGRAAGPLQSYAWDCDRIMMVVPAQLKAAVAAVRLLHEFPPVEAGLLVRARPGAALDASLISEAIGLPVQGRVPELRGVGGAAESGRLLELGKRRSVRHFAASVLDSLGDELPTGEFG
ncbi:secretion/DNA translocation related CpaE-like protein [Pseudarthrobacter sp. W1I19]|uniref:septum site-determining protein Ssd n=1 Tax=Pseudarthrobacter sp. W1I19 TaxID=3042288 RepID=UPI002782AC4E|nr:septum site-determining protein Ssd [Pseudarthrobacter sp. W1I19]MDQ0922076.1 secretion/DNA translocation related CpaE-like protein [Pseudarthrobacter sp. W1I19]